MVSLATLLLFAASSILLIIAPGPDIIFTITQGLTHGKKAGLFTAVGLSLGNLVHTFAAAFGLSVIFKTSELAFILFKTFGAIYLFYLAYKAFKHRKDPLVKTQGENQVDPKGLFVRGLVMNILNPKVALFFLAFLPQFVSPQVGSIEAQIVTLGLVFIILTAIIFGSFGYFAGSFGEWLLKRPNFSRIMNIASAGIFLGLGLKLLVSRR